MSTIPDEAVEVAVALLEGRGWERDDGMVADVRDALVAAQARAEAIAAESLSRRIVSERARRLDEQRREARWRHVSSGQPPGTTG